MWQSGNANVGGRDTFNHYENCLQYTMFLKPNSYFKHFLNKYRYVFLVYFFVEVIQSPERSATIYCYNLICPPNKTRNSMI